MSDQQPSTQTDETGLDRRKFLLRTTAVTAGAWAAPSILTIDRALAEHETGSPCPCNPGTTTDAATVKGTVVLLGVTGQPVTTHVRENACLNDDSAGVDVALPGSLGTVQALGVACGECGSHVETGAVDLLIGSTTITADALKSHARCCPGGPEGGSQVIGLSIAGNEVITSTEYQAIPIPGGTVHLNEDPSSPAGTPGEFNAVHIVYSDPLGNSVDLKLASSKVTCA